MLLYSNVLVTRREEPLLVIPLLLVVSSQLEDLQVDCFQLLGSVPPEWGDADFRPEGSLAHVMRHRPKRVFLHGAVDVNSRRDVFESSDSIF